MSLKQNDKKIKLLASLSIVIFFGALFWLIWQLLILNIKYNINSNPIVIEKSQRVGNLTKKEQNDFYIAASKSGTKYYYQNCAGLGRIKPENLVFFTSEGQAEKEGYALAKNCFKP